jgi:type IV secretory pathway VirB10-like protein
MTRTPPPFGTRQATRLHAGRIVLVLALLAGSALGGWVWLMHRGQPGPTTVTESSVTPGWTAAQLHYSKPEVQAEAPAPKPVDLTAAELARLRAMLAAMQAEIDALKNRKTTSTTVVQQPPPKTEPRPKTPGSMLFVSHDIKDSPPVSKTPEYVLAPGSTKLPCITETAINSDVPGYFTCRISVNVYDTATGRHLLVPQGSTVLGHDHSQDLIFGNTRLPTVSLTLALPDGRSVDLGAAPVTDQQGIAGLTGDVDNHWWRLIGAVFIGGALRGGTQAVQFATAEAAGAHAVVSGYSSAINQAVNPQLTRALDTRPTITVAAGQLANVLLIRPLSLPAMWQ